MRIIKKASEIGFCYGVRNAITIASLVANSPTTIKPIYLLGSLVHNHHVNEYFNSLGIIILDGNSRLEMLDSINCGTVIITAHGVSDKVINKAKDKNLVIVDATCPYVERTVHEMKKKLNEGHDLLFIGKSNHPETETALSLGNNVFLVNDDLDENIIKNPILCHQTTMSNYDIDSTYKKLKLKFSNLKKIKMVCNATEKRQKMIIDLEKYNFLDKSLIIVVGDKTSNNSTKLYEMAKRLNKTDVIFIDNISELNFLNLKQYDEIHLFSGTSTPKSIVDELYNLLLDLDNINIEKLNSKLTLIEYVKN